MRIFLESTLEENGREIELEVYGTSFGMIWLPTDNKSYKFDNQSVIQLEDRQM